MPPPEWREALTKFQNTCDPVDYLDALQLAVGTESAVAECERTFQRLQGKLVAASSDAIIDRVCAFAVRQPLSEHKATPAEVRVPTPEFAAAIKATVAAIKDHAERSEALAERHSGRYAGFWPATRLADVYGSLGEDDPALIIASYLTALGKAEPSLEPRPLLGDARLANHLLDVVAATSAQWNEPEPRSSWLLLLVTYVLGILPTLKLSGAPVDSQDATQERRGWEELLANIRTGLASLPQALINGLIRRLCEDANDLLMDDDTEDAKLFLALLELPVSYSTRIPAAASGSRPVPRTGQSYLLVEYLPDALGELGLAMFDRRLGRGLSDPSAELWKNLVRSLDYGPRELGVSPFTAKECATATRGLLMAAGEADSLESSPEALAEWLPLFPMLLNGYGGDWAFHDFGDDQHYDTRVIRDLFLAMHDVATRDGFQDLAAAILGVAAIELSLLCDQPTQLVSGAFAKRALSALGGPGSESLGRALALAKEALSQREQLFAARWLSQFISEEAEQSSATTGGRVPLTSLTAGSRAETEARLRRILPGVVFENLEDASWQYLVDAEMLWGHTHQSFGTRQQTDWGALVVAYFKVIEHTVVSRYGPIFALPTVRRFCGATGVEVSGKVSIGQVRIFLSKWEKFPVEIADLLSERRLALHRDLGLLGTLGNLVQVRNDAAHGGGKVVTAERFTRFRQQYFDVLPAIASRTS